MNKSVEIKELARHFHELYGCRYIAIELDELPNDYEVVTITLCGSDYPMEYFDLGEWRGAIDNTASIMLPLTDSTGEYSTGGEIDYSKCHFDFGEKEENEIV